jgi:membrane protein implicated in regulation of membrane protease activity
MPGFFLCVPGPILVAVPVTMVGRLLAMSCLVAALALASLILGWRVALRLSHGLAARGSARRRGHGGASLPRLTARSRMT